MHSKIMRTTAAPIPIAAFAFVFVFLVVSFPLSSASASASVTAANEEAAPAVYIVFVEVPPGEEPEAFHIRTLAAVLGSEAAAERAILFHYTHAASGFAAALTVKQVDELKKQPGVIQVIPSRAYSIHEPTGFDPVV